MKAVSRIFGLVFLCMVLLLSGCGGQQEAASTPAPTPTPEPVNLTLIWHGHEVGVGLGFGNVPDCGDDDLQVLVDGQPVTDFEVKSAEPDVMSAERTEEGRIRITRLQPFGVRMLDLIVSYKGVDYGFKCNDECWSPEFDDPEGPDDQPGSRLEISHPVEFAKITERKYSDDEMKALVDAKLPFEEACEKLSTVADAVQYLNFRGYSFQPEDQGSAAKIRYELNSGACVGGSALLNALLEGDYDDQGYVYIFYARGEHVIPFFVADGVYFYCDIVPIFNESGTNLSRQPVVYMTAEPESFYDAWLEIESHDLNDSNSDMYLGGMYTTGYFGDPTMPQVWLWNSDDGKYCRLELSAQEKESQQILFLREGYTFEF